MEEPPKSEDSKTFGVVVGVAPVSRRASPRGDGDAGGESERSDEPAGGPSHRRADHLTRGVRSRGPRAAAARARGVILGTAAALPSRVALPSRLTLPPPPPPRRSRDQHAPLDARAGGGFRQHRALRRRRRVRQGDRRGRGQDARGRGRDVQVPLRDRHARRRAKVPALPTARQAADAHAGLGSARRASHGPGAEARVRARAASGHMPSGEDAVRARRAARPKFRARRRLGRRRRRHGRRQRPRAALAKYTGLREKGRGFVPFELRRVPHEHDRDARAPRAQQIRAGDRAVRSADDDDDDETSVALLPLLQFYDSMHVASTRWYLSRVFGRERYCTLPKGGFIEDTLGQLMLRAAREAARARKRRRRRRPAPRRIRKQKRITRRRASSTRYERRTALSART